MLEELKAQVRGLPNGDAVTFRDLRGTEADPLGTDDTGSPNRPGALVRKQTRDIAATMKAALGMGELYLFLEDDMEICARGLEAIRHVVEKAAIYSPNWLALRFSYGMNGILLRQADAAVFADYLLEHQARRPPDHLVVEWYAGERPQAAAYKGSRAQLAFKYNIFDHLGAVSSLRSKKSPTYPVCFEVLKVPTLFKVEAFDPAQCPDDDLWPCAVPGAAKSAAPRVAWPPKGG